MENNTSLTILVNSTDSYDDCWQPFFKLFSIYWTNCPYPIVLNTNRKTFAYPGLNIKCSQVGIDESGKRLNWSDRLILCLNQIKTKYILYLQEDYFLNNYVNFGIINDFLQIMEREGYSHIRIMEILSNKNGFYEDSSKYPLLWKLAQKCNYRLSLQAGLWVKHRLLFYLKPNESGSEFERWGSIRANKKPDTFYCQNIDYFNRKEKFIYPYYATGITQGKWVEAAVVNLFKTHEIDVDYSNRGFCQPRQQQLILQKMRTKSRKLFIKLLSEI
ncbi:hypothetical protein [Calothrix sp. PCC 7507]|uniref:hypothetical protein n=1 Tax=Calothrix sp. PCC 7507 TaxID=99598 RepID=UPI00029EE6DF|nr:hypothetical protein [Calothrix sp. PCC 7507]AFY34481.1 hypothetical protein Cal7507_4099 [Calothrix sp. PCC 7507]